MVALALDILSIADNCDVIDYGVEITVFCDEKDLMPTASTPQAVLTRQLNGQGQLKGWLVQLRDVAADSCASTTRYICEVADGRVYTVRVCVTDAAGLTGCQDSAVGMTNQSGTPLSEGPIFQVAQDRALMSVM